MPRTAFVVLAAGRGVRMRSLKPKVLHEAGGRPLVSHVLATARAAGAERCVVVVGAGREEVEAYLAATAPEAAVVVQDPPLGTGDAVKVALPAVGEADAEAVIVLSGDVPLLSVATVTGLLARFAQTPGCAVAFLTARLAEPGAYGRVVRDGAGRVLRVVEAKDATDEERAVGEVNAGVYAFDRAFLESALPRLTNDNAAGEYYLTDLLGMAVSCGRPLAGIPVLDARETLGVNSRAELAEVDAVLRLRAARAAMEGGATLVRPETITIDAGVLLEPDVVVEPFVALLGETRVGSGSVVGQGSILRDCAVGKGVTIKPYTLAEKARVADGAIVGPFARLREGTELLEGVHVGNFVETKKAKLGKGAKANHLTYLGDVTVGARTNVGAGVITCNYDGFAKHQTTIGEDVFVGSDVQLVAPVTVGDGAIVGAGTTVTADVPADALAVARSPQRNVADGARKFRERRRAKALMRSTVQVKNVLKISNGNAEEQQTAEEEQTSPPSKE